jgi:hypothetical protein
MSQAGSIGSGSGGGTVIVETLTPNSGGAVSPVGNNINVVGLAANSGGNAFPIYSYNGGAGVFELADNAFLTPYVVDSNATPGQEGTFSTITAAINQAVADGATGSTFATIFLRDKFYFEALAFPNNASINIVGWVPGQYGSGIGGGGQSAILQTNITFGTSPSVSFSNINILSSGGNTITQTSGVLYIENCTVGAQSGDAYTTTSSSTATAYFTDCNIGTMVVGGNAVVECYQCFMGFSNSVTVQNSGLFGYYFTQMYEIILANAGVSQGYFSYFYNGGALTNLITGSSSATQSLYHNYFGVTASGQPVNATATFQAYGNVTSNASGVFGTSVTIQNEPGTTGNIQTVNIQAGNYTLTQYDQFVGATTSSGAPTMVLYRTPYIGMTQTIADISCNAAVNNVTISGNGNTITGTSVANTYVLNQNGASVTLVWLGTTWKVS